MSESSEGRAVAIVGGGAAGTFLALNLAGRGIASTIFDATGAFGRGLAYSATSPWHRLNVPIEKIGRKGAGEAQSFGEWFVEHHKPFGPDFSSRFVPRSSYGDWLSAQLDAACASGLVRRVTDSVVGLQIRARDVTVTTAFGGTSIAGRVALCLGNQPPRTFPQLPGEGVVADIWQPGALDRVAGADAVAILGTGATAVDAFLELRGRGHAGPITMLSRRGLLPLIDAEPKAYASTRDFKRDCSLSRIVRALRLEVATGAASGASWQSVVDAFRESLPALWQSLSGADRARFQRHLRPHWLVHRHRLAPDIADVIARSHRDGSLAIVRGRIRSASRSGSITVLRLDGGAEIPRELSVRWVLNCTGPEDGLATTRHPLLRDLLRAGLLRPGELGIGIDVDEEGRAISAAGLATDRLLVLGSATRMRFGEVTSAPQFRERAAKLADLIAGQDARRSMPNGAHPS